MKRTLIFMFLLIGMVGLVSAVEINITSPADSSVFGIGEAGQGISINYSIGDDDGLDMCWWNYNNVNTTIACGGEGVLTTYVTGTYDAVDSTGLVYKGMNITALGNINITKMQRAETTGGAPTGTDVRILDSTGASVFTSSTTTDGGANWSMGYVLTAGESYVIESEVTGGLNIINTYGATLPVSTGDFVIESLTSGGSETGDNRLYFTISMDYIPQEATLTLESTSTLPFHNLTIYANDTLGNLGVNSTQWEYNTFVNNQTWNNETTEGSVENFELNVTLGTGLTFNSATLVYNGTEYVGTITNTGGSEYNVSRTISIGNVVGTQDHEFYWNLALSNGEDYNTTTQQQQATELSIDDCTTYNTMILNYTLYDEETQLLIPSDENTTIEVSVDISPTGTTTPIIEFSKQFLGNNATICLDDLEGDYRMDVITKYSAFDYVVEYHHIQNFNLNTGTIPQHISLYDLLVVDSQEFLVVVKDANFLLVQDALVDISREYVSEGQFKSVEVAKTDSQGQTIVHLVLSDIRYNIIVKKEGEILATFDNVVAVCQDAGSGECTLNLNELATQVPPNNYENKGNINYYWTLDRDARTIQLDFTTISGVSTIELNVTKFDNFYNSTACSETLTSTTGTITCAVAETFGNTTFMAEVYSDGEFVSQAMFSLSPDAFESFGYAGVIMIIIMFMTIPLMFISSPVGMVFGAIISVIMMGLLQVFDGGGILGTSSAIIWFIIAGLILVWRISKGGRV